MKIDIIRRFHYNVLPTNESKEIILILSFKRGFLVEKVKNILENIDNQ